MKNENFLPDIYRPTARDFAFNQSHFVDVIFDRIVRSVEDYCAENSINKKGFAEIMGKDPALVSRWLNSPNNWQLTTVADFLTTIGMRAVDLSLEQIEGANPRSNHKHDFEVLMENTDDIIPVVLQTDGITIEGKAFEKDIKSATSLQIMEN